MKILLKDAGNPHGNLVVPVTVTIRDMDLKYSQDGEVVYVIEFKCGAIDKNGDRIQHVVLEKVSEADIKNEIKKGLSIIGSQINWPNPQDDESPPNIVEVYPYDQDTNISINSHVRATLRDFFPTTGINPDTIKLRVNGIDVTDELQIVGEDTEYRIRWVPTQKT